jgi:hypothetical protein
MKATRRRQRKPDPLASPSAVWDICERLGQRLPFPIPKSEKELFRLLYAIGHVERRPATDTKRGRPGRWTREQLTEAASILRGMLDRETQGRVSVKSFISQYLHILRFPADVQDALADRRINLQEAIQLSRLSPYRLGRDTREAAQMRREILEAHLALQGSQTGLRARVKEILGETRESEITTQAMTEAIGVVDELLEVDPADSRHLFWEQMKDIFFAMREVKPDDLDDEILEEFTAAMDQTSAVLYKIKRKKIEREQQINKATQKARI